jgi:hypothetical protein
MRTREQGSQRAGVLTLLLPIFRDYIFNFGSKVRKLSAILHFTVLIFLVFCCGEHLPILLSLATIDVRRTSGT